MSYFSVSSCFSSIKNCRNADKKAAIGFVYEDSTPANKDEDEENEEDSEEDIETADLGLL